MKNIILTHLQHKLPANQNFLQFINEEMHNNLIAVCNNVYPGSSNRAYVLSGLDISTGDGNINYSQGYIFYNNEIFFVPSFSHPNSFNPGQYGLIIQTIVSNETYKSGQILPAYEERRLILQSGSSMPDPLKLQNLIYKKFDTGISEIQINSTFLQNLGSRIVTNMHTQTLIMYIRILSEANSISSVARIYAPGMIKYGFLGMGKAINKTTQNTYDLCIYYSAGYIIIRRPYDSDISPTQETTWGNIWQYVNSPIANGESTEEPEPIVGVGGGIGVGGGVEEPNIGLISTPPANAEVYLSINLTHES
jgi:hypothetical protein